MESPPSRNQLGKRSILARIVAVLALAAVGVAIYLVVMSFTESEGDSTNDKKGRSKQAKDENAAAPSSYTVVTGDTLSGIAIETGVSEPRIERLDPDLDSDTLNAGQILALR